MGSGSSSAKKYKSTPAPPGSGDAGTAPTVDTVIIKPVQSIDMGQDALSREASPSPLPSSRRSSRGSQEELATRPQLRRRHTSPCPPGDGLRVDRTVSDVSDASNGNLSTADSDYCHRPSRQSSPSATSASPCLDADGLISFGARQASKASGAAEPVKRSASKLLTVPREPRRKRSVGSASSASGEGSPGAPSSPALTPQDILQLPGGDGCLPRLVSSNSERSSPPRKGSGRFESDGTLRRRATVSTMQDAQRQDARDTRGQQDDIGPRSGTWIATFVERNRPREEMRQFTFFPDGKMAGTSVDPAAGKGKLQGRWKNRSTSNPAWTETWSWGKLQVYGAFYSSMEFQGTYETSDGATGSIALKHEEA
eukprot:TRINITY_DN39979_c0_g2_i1.p1 TRINITY_DN39979_c0_g2~~TRINITY_DN39979_c0_g2_i1.p1  ORF type:complete len:368 (-),score=30.62 TRINITY_DN39979_c0_g2_i1:36-1139(-)